MSMNGSVFQCDKTLVSLIKKVEDCNNERVNGRAVEHKGGKFDAPPH